MIARWYHVFAILALFFALIAFLSGTIMELSKKEKDEFMHICMQKYDEVDCEIKWRTKNDGFIPIIAPIM